MVQVSVFHMIVFLGCEVNTDPVLSLIHLKTPVTGLVLIFWKQKHESGARAPGFCFSRAPAVL